MSGNANIADIPADSCQLQKSFWRAIGHLGFDPAKVLQHARLPVTLHEGERQFVTTAQFFALWNALVELADDPHLWLRYLEATQVAGHQPLFVACCYSANYGEALARLSSFKRYCTPELFHIQRNGDEVSIWKEWFHATAPEPHLSVDVSFAFLVALGRRGTGRDITPLRIELMRNEPATDVQREYYRCPIRHGAARDVLVLHARDLDLPFPGHNPELLAILTPALTTALAEFHPQTAIADQVLAVLRRGLPVGRSSLAAVASDLGVSERTLQRRITAEGLTFRELVTRARQELARRLLINPAVGIGQVATTLGFHNLSSFYRAFREWEGVTPREWEAANTPGNMG